VFHFEKIESLKTQLQQVSNGWVRQIIEAGSALR
jgi:hypothetical protein